MFCKVFYKPLLALPSLGSRSCSRCTTYNSVGIFTANQIRFRFSVTFRFGCVSTVKNVGKKPSRTMVSVRERSFIGRTRGVRRCLPEKSVVRPSVCSDDLGRQTTNAHAISWQIFISTLAAGRIKGKKN